MTRHYRNRNVWKGPYNNLYRYVSQYAERYGLEAPDRVNNPTLEDIEDLRRYQESMKEEAQEIRDLYKRACEAIDAVFARITPNTAWETEKYNFAKAEAETAKSSNVNNTEWSQAIIDHTAEIYSNLDGFVFASKQTWDKNTVHEDTTFWDALFEYIWGIA